MAKMASKVSLKTQQLNREDVSHPMRSQSSILGLDTTMNKTIESMEKMTATDVKAYQTVRKRLVLESASLGDSVTAEGSPPAKRFGSNIQEDYFVQKTRMNLTK